jgi:uncharacterized protein (TIGR00297 family)
MSVMQFGIGFLLALAISSVAYAARALSASGVLAAVVLGTLVYGLGGWQAAAILIAFFVTTSVLERALRPLAASPVEIYAKSGRRDGSQVAANGFASALFIAIGYLVPTATWPWVAFAGSVAAVTADTWATELGALSGTAPRLITRLAQRVRPGASGGVTVMGTASAALGGILIGALAALLAPVPGPRLVLPVAAGGLLAAFFDSVLGATVQGMYECPRDQVETEQHPRHLCGEQTVHTRGWRWLNNDAVNLASSLFGGLTALLLTCLVERV